MRACGATDFTGRVPGGGAASCSAEEEENAPSASGTQPMESYATEFMPGDAFCSTFWMFFANIEPDDFDIDGTVHLASHPGRVSPLRRAIAGAAGKAVAS